MDSSAKNYWCQINKVSRFLFGQGTKQVVEKVVLFLLVGGTGKLVKKSKYACVAVCKMAYAVHTCTSTKLNF